MVLASLLSWGWFGDWLEEVEERDFRRPLFQLVDSITISQISNRWMDGCKGQLTARQTSWVSKNAAFPVSNKCSVNLMFLILMAFINVSNRTLHSYCMSKFILFFYVTCHPQSTSLGLCSKNKVLEVQQLGRPSQVTVFPKHS